MSQTIQEELRELVRLNQSTIPQSPGWVFSSVEDLVARHGKSFQPATTSELLKKEWNLHAYEGDNAAHCYAAAVMRSKFRGWVMVEGYVRVGNRALKQHVWLTNTHAPSTAYDLDKSHAGKEVEYFGIPFKSGYAKHCFKVSVPRSYSLLETPWNNWQLLRKTKLLEQNVHSLRPCSESSCVDAWNSPENQVDSQQDQTHDECAHNAHEPSMAVV